MKKGTIGKIVLVVLAVAAIIVGAIVTRPNTICQSCYGSGKAYTFACYDCDGTGTVEGEDCETCEAEGIITVTESDLNAELESKVDISTKEEVECPDCDGTGEYTYDSRYYGTFMALVPPIVAILLALITKEVYSSLFVGIILGGLLSANWKPVAAMDNLLNTGLISAVQGTAGVFIFLIVLGVIVALVNQAGGSAAFGRWAETHIKTRAGACIATFVLGVLIFIDDYFNCLTVGSVMRPVTDRHKVSRAKLAYLIDATAAPVCMIAPISSWAAAVASYAPEGQGISLFVKAIPYNFYSLLTFVFIIAIVLMKVDFGPMRTHEKNAMEKGDLFTSGDRVGGEEVQASTKGKVIDLLLPVIVLIVACVLALLYVGGFWSGETFVSAFAGTDATVGLPWGGIIALIITIIYLICRKTISFKDAMEAIPKGFAAMVPAILILTFATALKNITNDGMGSAFYIRTIMSGAAGFANFLPAIIFLVAVGLSFATGTSWGTFGILIPIVCAIFPAGSKLLIIGMSACLAGAVCGDHCSPISDTTIMSSAGAQSNHINHVSTQLPYALTVAAISFVAYVIAGFVQNAYIVLPVAVAMTLAVLYIIKKVTSKKAIEQ